MATGLKPAVHQAMAKAVAALNALESRSRLELVRSYQTPALALEASPPPRAAQWTLRLMALAIATFVVWAALSSVDKIIIGRGHLRGVSSVELAQVLDRSILRSLNVRPGDPVRKGEIIAALDATFVAADISSIENRLRSLESQERRIRAEIEGVGFSLTGNEDDRLQHEIFTGHIETFRAREAALKSKMEGVEGALRANLELQRGAQARIDIVAQVVEMRRTLFEKNVSSRLQILSAEDEKQTLENELGRLKGDAGDLSKQLETARSEASAFASEWRRQNSEELVKTQRDIAALREEQKKALRLGTLVELRANTDGVVINTIDRSIGAVVEAGEPIASISPNGQPVEMDVEIESPEVGYLRVGQEVRVKLESLPFQQYGTLSGRLTAISGDSSQEKTLTGTRTFYRARVAITERKLRREPPGFQLIPGMVAVAEIKAGDRTVLSYLLNPITKGFDEALAEP